MSQTPVEPKTTPTDNRQPNLLESHEYSYSEIFTVQVQNLSVEKQPKFSEILSWKQTQADNERLQLQHQRRIEAANQISRKQELERDQLTQHLNQIDTENQHEQIRADNTKLLPSNSKKVPPHPVPRSEFSIPKNFMLFQKDENEHFLPMLLSFLKNS